MKPNTSFRASFLLGISIFPFFSFSQTDEKLEFNFLGQSKVKHNECNHSALYNSIELKNDTFFFKMDESILFPFETIGERINYTQLNY